MAVPSDYQINIVLCFGPGQGSHRYKSVTDYGTLRLSPQKIGRHSCRWKSLARPRPLRAHIQQGNTTVTTVYNKRFIFTTNVANGQTNGCWKPVLFSFKFQLLQPTPTPVTSGALITRFYFLPYRRHYTRRWRFQSSSSLFFNFAQFVD